MINCKDCKIHAPGCRKDCEFGEKHEEIKRQRYKKKDEERLHDEYLFQAIRKMKTIRKG